MNEYPPNYHYDVYASPHDAPEPVVAELVPPPPSPPRPRRPNPLFKFLPPILFVATCLSTFFVGCANALGESRTLSEVAHRGLAYSACLMTILICHEMGHYLQARRYRVPASLPFFIPVPLPPIGTMGAVIGMQPGVGDRRAIFDIGITGPLAGLVPTLIFCVVGMKHSSVEAITGPVQQIGLPLLMQFLASFLLGPVPDGYGVILNPMLFAAWVGLLITSINLIPIGQLDGGHILYALLRKKAHLVASWLLKAAVAAVVVGAVFFRYPGWIVMVLLLLAMGPHHPPTADDNVPLGPTRVVLGWLTLAFVLVGFTPMPFKM